ncbi:MAG: ATP-binding protein [Nanoarchaeota archaeon]|nr:ATP-binding protein [Nanoarchaeota archaeon]
MAELLGCVSGKINTHSFSFTAEAKVKKFQYIKLYHEEVGFILAQIVELTNEENKITCDCEIIGYRDSRDLLRTPNSTISHNVEVYNADSEFIKKMLGLDKPEGLYLGILEEYNMIPIRLDEKKLVTKHLAVLAKTGAGKSYTLGVIVEELLEVGVPCVIIDPHGEYSSLKYPNSNKQELELMHRYDVKPKGYSNVIEYSPNTSINPDAKPLTIGFKSLTAQEISTLTPIKVGGTQLGILYNVVSDVKSQGNYSLNDIRSSLDMVNSNAKYGLYACLDFIENVGVFSDDPVRVESLVNPGKATLINLKGVAPEIQRIIVAKLCHDLFEKRKKNQVPPFFLIVEEAHNFCPERSFGESPSSYILRNIASEGRKFGLGLGIVSQRPARVDKNVLSQCNTQIIQKVTNPNDLKAIASSAENINTSVVEDIATLPIGTALVIGASAKPVFVDVRIKRSEHGGKSVSFNYKEQPIIKTEVVVKKPEPVKKVEPVITQTPVEKPKIEINFIPVKTLNRLYPCYLANVNYKNKNFNLLLSEDNKILNNKALPVSVQEPGSVQSIGLKAETVLKIINDKQSTSVSYLFNALNYSFQDIDFILRDLEKKGLLVIEGSKLFAKTSIDYASFAFNLNVEKKLFDKEDVAGFKTNSSTVKSFLESKGLIVNNILSVYVK